MILYLVKGYLDLAATTLADAQALLTALANPALASNQAIIDKVTGKLETLVQSDSGEPLTISSIDDTAGSYSAWVTDAQTTLAVGLGLPNTSTLDTYASTTSFSITANTRTGTLALNSRELSNGLLRGGLRLQIRTTNSAGAAETRALIRINVVPGVLESPVGDRDVDYTSYVEVAALATAAAASAAAATTAETNAETAETNAETAQAAAAISAAAALVSENAASASASTATTQAGTATTQAGTATTQAGIATTQAGLATTAKTAAETAETNAETAETNAAASATAAGISAAAALVSEAAALVSKNAAAASAATASAVSGSGNGTFSAAALTGVNSVTASASTALTLTGGSTGASLVLGQGATAGDLTFTPTGSATAGTFLLSRRTSNAATLGTISYGADSTSLNQGTGYFHLVTNSAIPLLLGTNTAERARLTSTGNLLIGTTTDAASLAGGLVVNGSGAGAAASSTITGALRVTGGVGVSGAIYAGAASVFGSTVTAQGAILSPNTALFSTDAALSSYSTTNGVYLNGHAAGWLRLSGSGGGVATIQLNGGAAGSIAMNTATPNALVLNGTTGAATFAGALSTNGLFSVTGSNTETSVATAKVSANALGGIPRLNLINPVNPSGGKYGDLINTTASGNGALQFRFIDDAITSATPVFSVTGRHGATDSFVTAPGTGAHTFGTTNTVTMTGGALATTGAATFAGAVTVAGTVIHTLSATPASASATGTVGTMSWDANYIYICTATNTWKRVAIATW